MSEKYPSFVMMTPDTKGSSSRARTEATPGPSPPPLVRTNTYNLQNNPVTKPTPKGGKTDTDESSDVEMIAMKALYPLLYHLEKEEKELKEFKSTSSLTSSEIKQIDEKLNILEKKIYCIHELLELIG